MLRKDLQTLSHQKRGLLVGSPDLLLEVFQSQFTVTKILGVSGSSTSQWPSVDKTDTNGLL